MSRVRAVAVAGAVALAVVVPVGPAHAETVSEAPSAAAYFNRAAVAKPDASPQAPPNVAREVDGVAEFNLAVAAEAGTEDKVSFLFFPLSTLPVGATITKATLTTKLVPADMENVTANAAPERVAACKIVGSGFSTEDGEALTEAPERDCPGFKALGVASADGTAYTFDITSLATTWLELNDGLALTRDDDPMKRDTFQVVFSPDATLDLEYTGGEPVASIEELTAALETPPILDPGSTSTGSFDTGTPAFSGDTGGTGGASLGVSSGVTSAPSFGGGFGSAQTPVLSAEAPSAADPAGAAPEVAQEQPSVALPPTRQVGSGDIPLTPSVGFWLLGLLVAGLFAALSLIMGDPRLPAAASGRQSRLAQALTARARTLSSPEA